MHLSDALISPAVAGTMYAVSAGLLTFSVREIKHDFKDSRIPLMGVAGAFVFAAQMINFSIPGTGSSGHICGAVLLSVLFGTTPAFVVMAGVLLIQALFFADGGLMAYGCNLFNMAFFGCFLATPYVFKPIAGNYSCKWRVILAGLVSGMLALLCGAFMVTLQTLLSGVTQLPFPVFLSFMMPIHAIIGATEGIATACVILFVRKNLPAIVTLECAPKSKPYLRAVCVFAIATIAIGGGLSLFASQNPDGLEWSVARTSATTGTNDPLETDESESIADRSPLADYGISGVNEKTGTAIAGIIGSILCFLLIIFAIYVISHKKRPSAQAQIHA